MIRIRFAPMTLALALALAVPMAHARGLSDRDLNFNYIASNRDGVGMVRAFDDSKRTIVQFVDLAQQRPMLTKLNGTAIPYRAIGNYAVMDTIEPRFRVYSEGQMSVVSEIGLPPPTLPASAGVQTQPLESSPLQRALALAAAPTSPTVTAKVPPAPKVAPAPRVHTVVLGVDNARALAAATAPSKPIPKPVPIAHAAPLPPPPAWTVHRGETLHAALATWCKRAGWQLPQWDVRSNQAALANVTFHGTFVSAVTQMFDAYTQAARTQPGFHPLRVQVFIDQHLIHVMPAKDSNP